MTPDRLRQLADAATGGFTYFPEKVYEVGPMAVLARPGYGVEQLLKPSEAHNPDRRVRS